MFFLDNLISFVFRPHLSLLQIEDLGRLVGRDSPLEDYDDGLQAERGFFASEVNQLLIAPDEVRSHRGVNFSIMDLKYIAIRSDRYLLNFILVNLGIDLAKKEGLRRLNLLFQETYELYEKRYGKKIPDSLKQPFSTIKEIKDFLSSTGEGRLGTYKCDLAKIFFSLAKAKNNKKFASIKAIHSQISARVFHGFALNTPPENVSGSKIINSRFSGVDHAGNSFTGFDRYKGIGSIVGKEIANIKYNSLEDYSDLHGFTFRAQSKKELLSLIEHFIRYKVLDDISEIDIGYLFTAEDIDETDNISLEIKQKLYGIIPSSDELDKKRQEKGTSGKYAAAVIKGKMKYTDPNDEQSINNFTGIEIKFELEDNENEYGTSFHGVLDVMKIFRELTRLSGVIRFQDVIYQVNHFFSTLESQLDEKGKNYDTYISELYADLLDQGYQEIVHDFDSLDKKQKISILEKSFLKYCIRDLIPVKLNKRKSKVYFIHKNYEKQEGVNIQPTLHRTEFINASN